jgi:hypothetical protein
MRKEQFLILAKSFYEENISNDDDFIVKIKFVAKKVRHHFSGAEIDVITKTHVLGD